jgi:transposase InsO family protein
MGCLTPEVRRLIVRARRKGLKVKEITEIFNVSRWTVWRWTKRAYHPGRESYKDKPKRPHTIHYKVTWEVENAIIILRASFNWGTQRIKVVLSSPPPYIKYLLENVLGVDWKPVLLSRQTINQVLMKHRRNGYPPGGKRDWKYFRADSPNDMWQMDIKGPFSIDGERKLALDIIDDYSRFRLSCKLFTAIATKDVIDELSRCFQLYGKKPKKILVDQGSQFWEEFKDWCSDENIVVVYAPVHYPQAKGKVERDIRNFKEEFLVLGKVFDNHTSLLEEYNEWNNYGRYKLGIEDYPANLYFGENVAHVC